jgi:hypothetical protein
MNRALKSAIASVKAISMGCSNEILGGVPALRIMGDRCHIKAAGKCPEPPAL